MKNMKALTVVRQGFKVLRESRLYHTFERQVFQLTTN